MNNYVHEQRRLESVSGTFRRFFADVIAPAVQAAPSVRPGTECTCTCTCAQTTGRRLPSPSARRLQFVLRVGQEVRGVVALVELARGLAEHAVDHAASFHGWAGFYFIGPANHIRVFVHL